MHDGRRAGSECGPLRSPPEAAGGVSALSHPGLPLEVRGTALRICLISTRFLLVLKAPSFGRPDSITKISLAGAVPPASGEVLSVVPVSSMLVAGCLSGAWETPQGHTVTRA